MPCPPVLLLKEGLQEENYNRKGNSYKSYSDGSYSYKEGPYNEGGVLLGQRVSPTCYRPAQKVEARREVSLAPKI